jgi:outer membrane protein OmpA-like peptidoglycan-associated protein
MKPLALLALGGSLALLAACTDLQRLQATPSGSGGTEFTRALAQQYRTFAADEWSGRANFGTSEWFAAKALRANAGEEPPPEELDTWGPWGGVRNELAEARFRLVRALQGWARAHPADAARAQRAFDCWLARSSTITFAGTPWLPYAPSTYFRQANGQFEEPRQTHLESCKEEFYEALGSTEGAPIELPPGTVYFAPGGWTIDARAEETVRDVVAAARAYGTARLRVHGYTDRVGNPAQNQRLSQRRAEEVRRALLAAGFNGPISIQAFGQTELAAPTPPNVPDQRNRRAVVIMCPPGNC